MSDPHTAPMPVPSHDEILATLVAHDARNAALRETNRTALFAALATSCVTHVIVIFDGCGDSGQIESIEAKAGDAVIDLPSALVALAVVRWGAAELVTHDLPLADMVEHLAYDLLAATHCGWENNDGAYGEFTFDVAAATISLDYNERYVAAESYSHQF